MSSYTVSVIARHYSDAVAKELSLSETLLIRLVVWMAIKKKLWENIIVYRHDCVLKMSSNIVTAMLYLIVLCAVRVESFIVCVRKGGSSPVTIGQDEKSITLVFPVITMESGLKLHRHMIEMGGQGRCIVKTVMTMKVQKFLHSPTDALTLR